jgi:hypothetical protein
MTHHFEFRSATCRRALLRFVVLSVSVFVLLSLYPALRDPSNPDHLRAIAGLGVLAAFVTAAVIFLVSTNDSYVEVDATHVNVRFESFFHVRFLLSDIAAVRLIDPRPRWRYRWGLSTNFRDRIACSHGGPLVEIELARPYRVRLWPRRLEVRRLWLGLREADVFIAALRCARGGDRRV